jgi:hypothetical protein
LKALSVKASDRFQEMKMFQQALMMEPDEVNVKIPVGEIPTGSQKSFATNAEEQKTATANNLPEKDNRYKAMIICIAALITIGILLFFTAG